MAASQCSKFIEQYYKKHGRLPEYKLVWKAAIKISEALFTSTNKRIKQGAKRPHAKRTS